MHACLPPDAQKQGWTFLDLGAGKGRAVLSAAAKPYKQVVGVEFAAELAAIARANVRDSGHAPPRVSIIEGDATCTSLPDGALIVFLFNPFGPPAIDQVLERLVEHHRRTHAPVRIAYLNPEHEPLLLRHPGFKRRPLPRHMATLFAVASPYRLALFDAVSAICGSIRIRQRWCVDRSAIVCERQRHTGSFRKIVA
ncbi:MAG: class I SAM-dependent methyltransferase [Hyphomicrobiaceae bacterium]